MTEKTTLPAVFERFPGIATAEAAGAASHVHVDGDRALAVLVFANDIHGETARLAVDFIFSHMGNGRRLDGRAPVQADASNACPCATSGAIYFACAERQLAVFLRMLTYASARPMGPALPKEKLATTPLSFLLSHAFNAFERDYSKILDDRFSQPSLGVWSNVLRAVTDDGLRTNDLPKSTVLSLRGARGVLRDMQRLRWLSTEKRGRVPYLRLTAAGRRAKDMGNRLVEEVEEEWRRRFGAARVRALRESLAAVTDQFEFELPWCMTGYGAADTSVTGGNYVPAQLGPPRVPHHGQDWPVVPRDAGSAGERPLSALLSQALTMFTIDYEWNIEGYGAGLYATTNLLRFIGDDGMPLQEAIAKGGMSRISGNGKSGTERHLVTVVAPGHAKDGSRTVYLTPKGKRARDSFPHLVMAVERDWQARYRTHVKKLRTALEALDADLGENLANYPNTTEWFRRSMILGGAAEQSRA